MALSISHFGEISEIPPEVDMPLAVVEVGALTDAELRKLGIYRKWVLDGTPPSHDLYEASLRQAEEVTAEMAKRQEIRAAIQGHDPNLCNHPVYCTGAL